MELWDAYNEAGEKLGFDLVRGQKIPDGVYHLVCEVVVRGTDGDFLLMQRSWEKEVSPGNWEIGAGGSALKGEDALTGACRELREETGIEAAGELRELYSVVCREHHAIYQGYLLVTDWPKERIVLQEAYGAQQLGGIVGMVRKVIAGTLLVEGAGAVFYAIQFVPEFGILRGICYSVFHAVSAFCNAGIDILGEKSLAGYAVNPVVNLTTILLIVLSGIGFTVWFDVLASVREAFRRENPVRWRFGRLKLHSKLAIITTVILIAAGAAFIFIAEYGNQDTIGGMNTGQKLMASLFQSVTTRTAGFYTFSQGALHEESKLFCSVLMFIGGSPGGTAGGVKTTTFAMLILACVTFARGGNDTECMGRKISVANFRTGFCVVMVAFAVFITGTIAVLALEPDSVATIDVLYETASAVGTVGLTADLTPRLCRASQIVLMIMMYMGRLGPLTLVLTFAGKTHPRDKVRSLPKEQIMVG